MSVTITREFITPELAKKYLESNTDNIRNLSPITVRQYALDMATGRWQDNAEPIAFYEGGVLFNGQHRLAAIVKSGVSLWMTVARNVDRSVTIVDNGRARQAHQMVRTNSSAGSLASVLYYPNGKSTTADSQATKAGMVVFLQKHKTLFETIVKIGKTGIDTKVGTRYCAPVANSVGYLAITAALLGQIISVKQLQDFCKCVNSGLPLADYDCSAPLMLRKIYQEGRQGADGMLKPWSISKGEDLKVMALVTYEAIEHFAKGKKVKKRFTGKTYNFEELRSNTMEHLGELEERLDLTTAE